MTFKKIINFIWEQDFISIIIKKLWQNFFCFMLEDDFILIENMIKIKQVICFILEQDFISIIIKSYDLNQKA